MKAIRPGMLSLFIIGFALSAQAQATRTWVSGVGDDANPCSRTAPCKTFAGAISKTAAGGEISVLDPGGFGAVTITKSITIDGKGQIASILASGTNGVIINALSTDKVCLRNIEINGAGTAVSGVKIINAGTVLIENCAIFNIGSSAANHGVLIQNTSSTLKIGIINTTIHNAAGNGIFAGAGPGLETRLVLNRVNVFDNGQSGLILNSGARAVISNSTFTHNANAGVLIAAAGCEAELHDSVIARNLFGLHLGASGGGIARISGCEITQNTADGLHIIAPATVESHGNNAIAGNGGSQAVSSVIGQQ